MGMRGSSNSCNTCRQRRVKCDGVRPVCGRCLKGHRQCLGFDAPNRLILKDETQTVIKRFRNRSYGYDSRLCSSIQVDDSPTTTDCEMSVSVRNEINGVQQPMRYQDDNDTLEWFPGRKIKISPVYEQNQVALFCCRETVNLRTLSWIMSDEKWINLLPEMMGRSEALTSVIYANAATYIAKTAGATTTPQQAVTHYLCSLRQLQQDLYSPDRQTSDETLFAIILLGLHNNRSLGSWQAHVQGATKVVQCKGSDYYKSLSSPARVLAKYVRGFDIIRAMSNQEETIFGDSEWDHLHEGVLVRPLDSLLYLYGKITNLIARSQKIGNPTVETMSVLISELTVAKKDVEEWKKNLPSYYEPIVVPVLDSELVDNPGAYERYPYTERLEYVTGFIGHTMNMYRAAILRIDHHLLGNMYPNRVPSERELMEIVMSMPSLYTGGGIFLLYPAMRAAKVLSREDKLYIVSMLHEIASEVPVADNLAEYVLEFEMHVPSPEECRPPANVWDIQESYIGS